LRLRYQGFEGVPKRFEQSPEPLEQLLRGGRLRMLVMAGSREMAVGREHIL
jgi:hypothetical protein